ncbi:Serum response factor-binding protein 1 like protein [Argiope bruennichi]|uniref:Serum response factor-binding protein 1 like protein n=2 Tax=Argiope bruennichi TaxID=94029 RepID=A0A8T0EGL5_ARGBR|nr:Serum response factor-binding protein 1 like protein [Argiope bruennichi]
MRKFVKQAKIHAINKCTKQIKFLENRKGNEEQIAKTKRKLQRLLEEVNILKKIKPDSVSKLALSKAKDWKAVLAEKNIPLEERCFAMLANHPPVQKCVEKFHNDNSELIPKIPELVKQWEEKKSKRSQMLKQKQKVKQNDVKNPNTVPIGNKNNFHKSSEIQTECQNSESLESLPDSSDIKNFQKDTSQQNLKNEKAVRRKVSLNNASDNLVSVSIPNCRDEKKLLTIDDAESDDESDASLSNSSDFSNHLSNQVKEKTNNDKSYKHSKKSETSVLDPETNLAQEKVLLKSNSKEPIIKSDKEGNSEKMQGIRSKLLEISMSKTKVQNKPRSKSSTIFQQSNAGEKSDDESSVEKYKMADKNANISNTKAKPSLPINLEVKNKIKAITMLDLNELQDVDEIPIEKSDSDIEDENSEDSGKQKKDPFFLRDGEPVSESDEDETVERETMRKRDFPSFKKKQYGAFNKREQRDHSFPKSKFEKHSMNGRNSSFRENSFMKNKKESTFKGNKRNFKQTFDDNSEYRQNKNFKFASKDKFNKRNGLNNFAKNHEEKTFSQNHSRDSKWSSHSSKPNLSNSPQKNKPDDKPLHPSWEAKRKLKEAATLKFQGKRMVFND